jgi:RNA polymerase sigma-70 factor (ECF subfamily)
MATESRAAFRIDGNSGRAAQVSDERLVALARGAATVDERRDAASRLLERYRDPVYIWCRKYLRDHDNALDAAQEVLISAHRNLASFGGRARFSSWIFAITRNRCLSERRKATLPVDADADYEMIPTAAGDPEQLLLEQQGEEALLQLIAARLDGVEQEALWLRCVEMMPVDVITTTLGITEASGARAVLQRARRKLKVALARRANETGGPEW